MNFGFAELTVFGIVFMFLHRKYATFWFFRLSRFPLSEFGFESKLRKAIIYCK